jgi:hypothetical protein
MVNLLEVRVYQISEFFYNVSMSDGYKKILAAAAFLIWSAVILSAFYITQRPLFPQVIERILVTLWAIALTAILIITAAGIGYFIFKRSRADASAHERLVLGTGLGLGVLGLMGYGLAAIGLANAPILLAVLAALLGWILISKAFREIGIDLRSFIHSFQAGRDEVPAWLPPAVLTAAGLGFFFALLPPAEGFDGLFYHLTLPERLLADKQIVPYIIPQFWFPSLIEGDFIWALGLGSERTAQLIHWSFSILTLALVWEWSHAALGSKPAWWSLAVLVSMPSLPWLSSWAYNDFALVFLGMAALYAVWKWDGAHSWLLISGMSAGMAMGIKYTSFILPVFCVFLIFLFGKNLRTRITAILFFSLTAVIIASPWYFRNWLIMGNPLYPFAFGGRGWDSFLAAWYSGNGSGIGWDAFELILLPFNIMLGHRDQNYFDGRIGPLFLLLLPLAIWAIWKKRLAPERKALFIISAFAFINSLVWAFGVIQTSHLWQARLLLPGLIPFAIPIGLGITLLDDLDLPRLRVSFISVVILGLVIAITLFDNTISLIARRPMQNAFGIESRQAYFQRWQPRYASALTLVESTSPDAYVYFFFEPRSYNMPRTVQPDAINSNLAHDFHLFGNAAAILSDWRSNGYTHVLVYTLPVEERFSEHWEQIRPYLHLEAEDGDFKLYSIQP